MKYLKKAVFWIYYILKDLRTLLNQQNDLVGLTILVIPFLALSFTVDYWAEVVFLHYTYVYNLGSIIAYVLYWTGGSLDEC